MASESASTNDSNIVPTSNDTTTTTTIEINNDNNDDGNDSINVMDNNTEANNHNQIDNDESGHEVEKEKIEQDDSSTTNQAKDESNNNNDDDDNSNSNNNNNNYDVDVSSKPIKKARTAYFIFQQEKRSLVIQELSNTTVKYSVADVAKRIGQMWSNLSNEEKDVYQSKARKEKELYEKYKNSDKYKESSLSSSSLPQDTNNISGNSLTIPVARIRKICRLDPDVKGISKESTFLITKAAEIFLSKIANDTMAMARMNQKRTIYPQDVADICALKEVFFFLRDDIKDLIEEQKVDKKRKQMGNNRMEDGDYANEGEKNVQQKRSRLVGVKPLTSYFTSSTGK